jgi:hypothetical protein
MTKLHYLQTPDGEVQFFDCYIEERMDAVRWILDQGYELCGES